VPALNSGVLSLAVALRAVPIITTAPLIVLALGRGATGTITIVAVMIFFPVLIACLQGLRQTPGQIGDLFDSYGAGPVRLLLTARIPSMLPAFFASARMAVPAALLAVTTTEWLATGKGIGVLMALTSSTSNYNMLWSCVVVLSLAAVIGYGLVAQVERAVLRVYASEQIR
jgi:ABC-type nitrate/sulfonate/bicarbonate transport system permease component